MAPKTRLKRSPPPRILEFPNYPRIGHLPGSKIGEGDKLIDSHAAAMCLNEPKPWHIVFVQEKLDGANVGVFLHSDGQLIALSREGYSCDTSPYPHFKQFAQWVRKNEHRFRAVLQPGERLCGEWLIKTHGIRYQFPHEPFVVFDIIQGKDKQLTFDLFLERIRKGNFVVPKLIHRGEPLSIERLRVLLATSQHGGEMAEGAVYRVERHFKPKPGKPLDPPKVLFLAKYVFPETTPGRYMNKDVWNTYVESCI